MKELGGPAYLATLTGSGAAIIGAKDFAQQVYDLALLRALIGVGRDLVEGALDTSEDVAPLEQIERAETELYKVAEEGGGRRQGQELRRGDQAGRRRWPRRRSTAAAICPASRPASRASTPRSAACTSPTSSSSPAVRAWARPRSRPTSPSPPPQRFVARHRGRDRAGQVGRRAGRLLQPRNVGRPARHAYPRRAVGHQLREPAHGQDQPAGVPPARPRRRASCRACRSTSTTRRA